MGVGEHDLPFLRSWELPDGPVVRTLTAEGPGSVPPWELRFRKPCGAAKKKKVGKVGVVFQVEQIQVVFM